MSDGGTTDARRGGSKSLTVVSAVVGAVFTYFSFTLLTIPLLAEVFGMDIFHYRNFPLFLGIVAATGAGLWVIAWRYRTSQVQAGAFLGAAMMTIGGFLQVWGFWNDGLAVPLVVSVPVGLAVLLVVSWLAENPGSASGSRAGISVLWRSLPFVGPESADVGGSTRPEPGRDKATADGRVQQEPRRDRPPADDGSGTERVSGLGGRFSVSRYWLVVGSAFAVTVPIAWVRPDFGLGLLTAFLTAYALSHRIEDESSDVD